jgi:hypothetical protein
MGGKWSVSSSGFWSVLSNRKKNVHCIGDRANHILLDIFEDILTRQGGNVTDWRPRIEHAQIMTPEDLERTGRIGGVSIQSVLMSVVLLIQLTVIASVQPTHA